MSQDSFHFYGGVEGGASNTKFVLVRSDGKILANSEGGGTNQYLLGVDECLRRINALVQDALKAAGLPLDTVLEGLGMSLSGGDEKPVQDLINAAVKKQYPSLTKHTFVGSDTQSVLASALPKGGVVMIAGTGSNCQLINPDGTMARCGGWGHMIGDEASGCWISLRAIKVFFDHEDGFVPCSHSVAVIKDVIYEYFKVQSRGEILDHLYAKFDKAKFSGLCTEVAKAALEKKDPLCCEIFREAGSLIAQHLYGISGKINKDLLIQDGGLPVVCVGSVFKSWKLLEEGFVQTMQKRLTETNIKEVTLLRLTAEASIGAAALGAKVGGRELPIDYANNASVFFHSTF